MVLISREEENIAVQLEFGVLAGLVGGLELIRVFDLVEFVTLVVSAGRLVMVRPLTEAHPTKLIFTHLANHMIAAAAPLDGTLARLLGTHFGVGKDPVEVLALG
jgi:hypothetical protein